jgi:hypothetical protein
MYRTTNINEAVQLIYNMGAAFGEIQMGQGNSTFRLVPSGSPHSTFFEPVYR